MFDHITTIALDHGGTLTPGGDTAVDPDAAKAVHVLHEREYRLILASNTADHQEATARRPRLHAAGILDCFDNVVLSAPLGYAKPDPLFYRAMVDTAAVSCERILFVGDNVLCDVNGPRAAGMPAVLIADHRPLGLAASVPVISHIRELPDLLAQQ